MTEWAPLIAFMGGVIGVVLTSYFQQRQRAQAERAATAERVRMARAAAYAEFASRAMDFRRAQLGYGFEKRRDPIDLSYRDTPEAADKRRTSVGFWSAYYRVRLLTEDAEVLGHAKAVADMAEGIADATDEASSLSLGAAIKDEVGEFVAAAQKEVIVEGRVEGTGIRPPRPRGIVNR